MRTLEGLRARSAVVELPGRHFDAFSPERAADILLESAVGQKEHDVWTLSGPPKRNAPSLSMTTAALRALRCLPSFARLLRRHRAELRGSRLMAFESQNCSRAQQLQSVTFRDPVPLAELAQRLGKGLLALRTPKAPLE